MGPLMRYHCALATIITHFSTVCKVVCCSKSSKVFCFSNMLKVFYSDVLVKITWALCCFQPKAHHCSMCSWREYFSFFFFFFIICKAGMIWQQEYHSTTSQLKGNQTLKVIQQDTKCLDFWKRNNKLCWGTCSHSFCVQMKNLRLGFLPLKFRFSGVRHLI